MIVIDASVIVAALVDDFADGERARSRLVDEQLHAPHVLDLEVASALRRLVRQGLVTTGGAAAAFDGLGRLPLRRISHVRLLPRCWDLRENPSIYDACYVALAEALQLRLLTADRRLAGAPGIRCDVELLA